MVAIDVQSLLSQAIILTAYRVTSDTSKIDAAAIPRLTLVTTFVYLGVQVLVEWLQRQSSARRAHIERVYVDKHNIAHRARDGRVVDMRYVKEDINGELYDERTAPTYRRYLTRNGNEYLDENGNAVDSGSVEIEARTGRPYDRDSARISVRRPSVHAVLASFFGLVNTVVRAYLMAIASVWLAMFFDSSNTLDVDMAVPILVLFLGVSVVGEIYARS